MVIKGGALRLGIMADIPRKMCDMDIVVMPEDYKKSVDIALEMGFTYDYGAGFRHLDDSIYKILMVYPQEIFTMREIAISWRLPIDIFMEVKAWIRKHRNNGKSTNL